MNKKSIYLHNGDCIEVLKTIGAACVDSLVTDPPAGISFMGKSWDHHKGGRKDWISWMESVMRECLRVLKPGAHAFVWAIPRTSHWTATALEDAGFEIRDVVTHLFGSGFPKSLDISKAIDKQAGAEREVVGYQFPNINSERKNLVNGHHDRKNKETKHAQYMDARCPITSPSTPDAKKWQGFGTALKPASEHWILCRKPLSEKTVAANVLKWGVGGINIDQTRIKPSGRFPANLVLGEEAARMLDEQSGTGRAGKPSGTGKIGKAKGGAESIFGNDGAITSRYDDINVSGASRFFYVAKASKRERNEGCGNQVKEKQGARPNSKDSSGKFPDHDHRTTGGNNHPTVKPIKLMRYLTRLVTPPGGTVLDPFAGSGSTGVAAIKEGFKFIGIEKELEYTQIAEKRIYYSFPEFKKTIENK